MRGHEDILRMRREGDAPSIIHIETAAGFDRFGSGTKWPFGPDQPQVHIGPAEPVRRLDLRFVVGMFVQVSGLEHERVRAVVEACIRAKADRVVGVTHRREVHGSYQNFPVVQVTDTKGDIAWQE